MVTVSLMTRGSRRDDALVMRNGTAALCRRLLRREHTRCDGTGLRLGFQPPRGPGPNRQVRPLYQGLMLKKLKNWWWPSNLMVSRFTHWWANWGPYWFTYTPSYANRVFGVGWRQWCLKYYYKPVPGVTAGLTWCNYYGVDCGG